MDYFQLLDGLEGVPVINVHLWFDRKLTDIDHLLFSRSHTAQRVCRHGAIPARNMPIQTNQCWNWFLAPAKDWVTKSDEEIVDATMTELARLFPQYIPSPAQLLKSKVVKNASFCLHGHPRTTGPSAQPAYSHPELLSDWGLHHAALSSQHGTHPEQFCPAS